MKTGGRSTPVFGVRLTRSGAGSDLVGAFERLSYHRSRSTHVLRTPELRGLVPKAVDMLHFRHKRFLKRSCLSSRSIKMMTEVGPSEIDRHGNRSKIRLDSFRQDEPDGCTAARARNFAFIIIYGRHTSISLTSDFELSTPRKPRASQYVPGSDVRLPCHELNVEHQTKTNRCKYREILS